MQGRIEGPELLMRLLDAAALRQRVIADNLSNQNTPGFQRRTVVFEDLLRQADRAGTDPRSLRPQVLVDTLSPAKPDGNNVQPEQEVADQRGNRLMYEIYLAVLNGHYRMIETSIQSGR